MSSRHHHHRHNHHHSHQQRNQSKESGITPHDFFFNFHLGFTKTPSEVAEDQHHRHQIESRYTRALCLAIGSGGVYTPEQVRYLKGLGTITSPDNSMVDLIEPLLQEAADLLDVELVCSSTYLTDLRLLENAGRSMVYDMYTCAALADFPEPQMVAISLIAEELGVAKFGLLEHIRKQVELEVEMRKNRIKLLFPEGHPMLEPKYASLHKEQQSHQ
ncbi:expressed unknown protein [Seminavis robusta]|uniref:Uncharacterized protein n=1 Tax=Seminavis robusta TaxID=568900 RepID=A0A9N8DBH6_9STRA|nr:expressed unknown protein [Seminavis robusta]|eukprot:Sro44_g026730.1 n/a (216) ;mRNA; r:135035-135682